MIPFQHPERIDDVFCKVLTQNDDSGRHGVLIPVFAYRLFPDFNEFDPVSNINYEESITTHWFESAGCVRKESKWKHYHRYPERRMTSLSPELLNTKEDNTILVVAKYRDVFDYECHVFPPSHPEYHQIGELFKFNLDQEKTSGLSSILPYAQLTKAIVPSVLDELIEKVKLIRQMSYVPTKRRGDTGVGYTFETLLNIDANSAKTPDYKGIEIKCSRSKQPKQKRTTQTGKQTLFSLIPNWGLAGDRKGLVQRYGYQDHERGRIGLYCTIKKVPNSLGWSLEIAEADNRIYVRRDGIRILDYSMDDLKKALESKHRESVFVIAHVTTGMTGDEQFLYDTVIHAKEVIFSEFIALIKENLIGLDFAIHMIGGKARDHGFLWRLENKKYLLRLFKYVQEVL